MKHLQASIAGKKWPELSKGELIVFSSPKGIHAAVLMWRSGKDTPDPSNGILVLGDIGDDGAICHSEDSFRSLTISDRRSQVLSLGCEWELRPTLGKQSLPFSTNKLAELGSLCLDGESAFIVMDYSTPYGGREPTWLNLETMEPEEPKYGSAVPILHWELWTLATGDDRPFMVNCPSDS